MLSRTNWLFFYHILDIGYDNKICKVYHIAFYHILRFGKSLSYCIFSYFLDLYHIYFIIFQLTTRKLPRRLIMEPHLWGSFQFCAGELFWGKSWEEQRRVRANSRSDVTPRWKKDVSTNGKCSAPVGKRKCDGEGKKWAASNPRIFFLFYTHD